MMTTLQLREAKAQFSAIVDAAEKGEPTIDQARPAGRHGRAHRRGSPLREAEF
ncbi:MAG TPA: hypothetical protein VF744_09470 [Beijerinckiaceae bacterium]|jgi:hypothetical protein